MTKDLKKDAVEKQNKENFKLALSCDRYIDGEDRIAGYIVFDGGPVGGLEMVDLNRLLAKGELKFVFK